MKSRLLRTLTAGVVACAFLAPASVSAANAADRAGSVRAAAGGDNATAKTSGGHGARTCLEGQNDPAVDSPTALNMVSNCSFESKDFVSSRHKWEFVGDGNSSRVATENLADGTTNSYGLIDTGAINNALWQAVPTVPGRTYVVSADVRVGAADGSTPTGVVLTSKGRNPDGSQNQSSTTQLETDDLSDATEWTHKTFTFDAVNWKTLVGIVKWAATDPDGHVANTTLAMDNLTVHEQEEYELVWNDEFDGDALDQSSWGYELGNVRGNEQQHYSSSTDNVDVVDGDLVLAATDRPVADQYRNTARHGNNARTVKYNSGSVRTEGREEFLYGRLEARMTLPEGKGAFPAFWMLGADFPLDGRVNQEHGYGWPSTGELDIMEIIGAPTDERAAEGEVGKAGNSNAVSYGTPHFYYPNGDPDGDGTYAPTALGGNLTTAANLSEEYHVFGIDWNPDYIAWYVDGVAYNVMYFPTDATTKAGNEAFIKSEIARFQAASAGLNRPQYLQLNLATGGNWAGDAGDHLAEDGASLKVDWVRYYRSASQQAAADVYYADQPTIVGAENTVMRAGEAADLLDGVSTDDGYSMEYSIDNEAMFVNGGVAGGRNEVSLVVKDSSDTAALQALKPGVYSLHYSALEDGATYSGGVQPEARAARTTVLLTVLPEDGLHGTEGETLASVALPDGWTWVDDTEVLGEEAAYSVVFTQAADVGTAPEARRSLTLSIPADQITGEPSIDIVANVENRCMAGKAFVGVRANNTSDESVTYTIDTAYGAKTVVGVAPGKNAFHSFTSRLASLPAGSVTVTATTVVDGKTISAQQKLDFAALNCK